MSTSTLADRIAKTRRFQVRAIEQSCDKTGSPAPRQAPRPSAPSVIKPVVQAPVESRSKALERQMSYEDMLVEFNELLPAVTWLYGFSVNDIDFFKSCADINTEAGRQEVVLALSQWKLDLIANNVDSAFYENGEAVMSETLQRSARAYLSMVANNLVFQKDVPAVQSRTRAPRM
jgi:hypothetical protein